MELSGIINKHKSKILNIGIIILAVIVANNIYQKQNKELAMMKAGNDALMQKNGVLENIGELEIKIGAYKDLLSKKEENRAMNTFNSLAQDLNITISSIRPLLEEKHADYSKFPFDLSISAPNYNAIGKFISAVENSQDVFQVEFIAIRPDRNEKVLNVELKISSVEITD